MTVALAAMLAFGGLTFGGTEADAATNREARAKPGRAAATSAPATRSAGPAARAERPATARRSEARAEPRGRAVAEARGRGERSGSRAEGRPESRGRVLARADERRGARGGARGARQAEVPEFSPRASYRTVGLFSRTAAASTPDDDGSERRGGGKMTRGGRGAWHAGLPDADGEQTACPAGTMSVLAQGHSSMFRCMPI